MISEDKAKALAILLGIAAIGFVIYEASKIPSMLPPNPLNTIPQGQGTLWSDPFGWVKDKLFGASSAASAPSEVSTTDQSNFGVTNAGTW